MEFRYDTARENVSRLPLLLCSLVGCAASGVGGYFLVTGLQAIGVRVAILMLALLFSGPVCLSIYISHLLRHMQFKTTRLVLEDEALRIIQGTSERSVELAEIDYAHHTGSMLQIRLRNGEAILLPAQFTNQEELLRRLASPQADSAER